MRFQTVLSLILDDNNVSIIYPRLQILEVDNLDSSTNGSKLLIDKSIAPFPVLRCLKWNMVYIFEDDTLFRKNGGTLEYLDIEVDTELAAILQKHQVFADGKYSRLGHVSVRIIGCDFSAPLEPDLFIRFAISLIATETREMIGLHINELVDSGFYNSHLDKIQCLLRNMGCLDSCDKIASC
ncbi:hypothetical protein LPJ81_000308 [Coemansia sp. IMI 209127]|nr:hypothetical protein LPJ81_000308 [Coemansia sp. IMI 209127]